LRLFFRRLIPNFERVLLVESGSRALFEELLPGLYPVHPEIERIDLVTCFPGVPKGYDASRGKVYRVTDYAGRAGRKRLFAELRANGYSAAGIICSGEAIMTKWKWVIAARVPCKFFVLNENGDYFWLDYSNAGTIKHFALYRAGLAGADAVPTIARILLFPFTFTYLLAYAAAVHLRRKVRSL